MATSCRLVQLLLQQLSGRQLRRRRTRRRRDWSPVAAEVYEDRCLLSIALPVDTATEVNESRPGLQSDPSAARGENGEFLAAWREVFRGSHIVVRRFSSGGTPLGAEFRINEWERGARSDVTTAGLSGGGYVAVWNGAGQDDVSGVFGRVLNAQGEPVGAEFSVNEMRVGIQRLPDVVAQPDGGFVVVWQGRGAGDTSGVFARRFDSDGTPQGSELLVNATTRGTQQNASIANLADGEFVISWNGRGADDLTGIYFRRFNANGHALGPETPANETTRGLQYDSAVSDLTDGTFALAWNGSGPEDPNGVVARIFNSDGSSRGGEFQVNETRIGGQRRPTILHRGPEGFVVAWDGPGEGDRLGVFQRQFSVNGVPVTGEELVNSTSRGHQRSVAIAGGSQGIVALYSDAAGVSGRAYATNLSLTDDAGVQQMPSVAVNPLNADHVVVAYMDYSLVDTGYAGIGVTVSRDGGVTWETTEIPVPEDFNQGAANPIAAFDDQGRLYLAYQAATFLGPEKPGLTNPDWGIQRTLGFQSNNGIFVVRSDDGGNSWNTPVGIETKLYDGMNDVHFDVIPDIAVDRFRTLPNGEPNPNYGNLYVTFSRNYVPGQFPGVPEAGGGIEVMIAVSRDNGRTWAIQREITSYGALTSVISVDTSIEDEGTGTSPGEGYIGQAHPAIGSEGEIYVSHFGGGNFAITVSRDGAQSFQASDLGTGHQIVFGTGFATGVDSVLPHNGFRTDIKRAIAADPTRPGHVYAVEPIIVTDEVGNPVDAADVFFGRSTDGANSWETTFQVGSQPDLGTLPAGTLVPLNDENGVQSARTRAEVASGQAFSRIVTDADGNIAVIWYDTRRDPHDTSLDVFGTISTDGGQTFTPNFRITNQSSNANDGAFLDVNGDKQFYIGDFIGLAMAGQTGYAAWTDTRNGNQDIYFARIPLTPEPGPSNDRFESNESPKEESSTRLGPIIQRTVPKLSVLPGDEDWFSVEASATGNLIADLLFDDPHAVQADAVRLELRDESGADLLKSQEILLDEQGSPIGRQVIFPARAGEPFRIRVAGTGHARVDYSLRLQSLTQDLGTRVQTSVSGAIADGDIVLYAVQPAANGSVALTLSPSGNSQGTLQLRVLDADTSNELASTTAAAGEVVDLDLQVRGDESLLLEVTGLQGAGGAFDLEFTNFDRVSVADSNTRFVPLPGGPSQATISDLNNDSHRDVVIVNGIADTVSVLLGNGDGSLQAVRESSIGAYVTPFADVTFRLPTFGRDVAAADFNQDGIVDFAATNFASSDVSVMLGNGDGTMQPQRRFDLTPGPFDLDVGDINGDGLPDIIAIESGVGSRDYEIGILLGKGDGTFRPQSTTFISLNANNNGAVRIVDLNEDGSADIVHSGGGVEPDVAVFLGNGDGTFNPADNFLSARIAVALAVGDINGDNHQDVATTGFEAGEVVVLPGRGDGTFEAPIRFSSGGSPTAAQIVDIGSQVTLADGSKVPGPPDGRPDLVLSDSGVGSVGQGSGTPEVVVHPAIFDGQGTFVGFGDRQTLTRKVEAPLDVDVADLDADGTMDAIVTDRDGILIVFGAPLSVAPNDTLATAQDLGPVVHLVQPTLTIVPDHTDDYFKLTVPTEAGAGGDQVIDFSALFEAEEGNGLRMEVLDASRNVLASGSRFRLRAAQGEELVVHISGADADSFGAYTLVINVLPQVVSVESQVLLPGVFDQPGGPTGNIVVTLQGDRLDPSSAQDVDNYVVTHFGADGQIGTADDVVRPVDRIVFSSATNVEASSGRTFPTTVRQTINLEFGAPLEAGSYQVEILPDVQTQVFNDAEVSLLAQRDGFTAHPVVSVNGQIEEGAIVTAVELVQPAGALGDFSDFASGTPYLTQLHDDLVAILDSTLSQDGDDANLTAELLSAVSRRIALGLGAAGNRPASMLVIVLDPIPFDLDDPKGGRIRYDEENPPVVEIEDVFVEVGGNVEVVVIPDPSDGDYELTVTKTGGTNRGGYVLIAPDGEETVLWTPELRDPDHDGTFRISI